MTSKLEEKRCLNCGVMFMPQRKTAKFHEPACRVEYARKNDIVEETGEIIENPLAKPPKDDYDPEKALAAFKKMGLEPTTWITTGIAEFDRLTMIPRGRITQIQGPYAVGKTTLALNMIAGLRDKKVFYVDSEASLNPHLLVHLRLDPKNFVLWNKSAYLEDIHEVIYEAAKSGKYDMIVFDSLAACTTRVETEGNVTDSNIGQKAKMVNKMMRILPSELKEHNTALVIINQEREVIGGYVPQKYTPGGMGVPYAASLMISLKTIKSWRFGRTAADTKKGIFIGHEIEATVIKSKVGKPWIKTKFRLYYPEPVQEVEDASDPQF